MSWWPQTQKERSHSHCGRSMTGGVAGVAVRETGAVSCVSSGRRGTLHRRAARCGPALPRQPLTPAAARRSTDHPPARPLSCPDIRPEGTQPTGGATRAPPLRLAARVEPLSREQPHCTDGSCQRTPACDAQQSPFAVAMQHGSRNICWMQRALKLRFRHPCRHAVIASPPPGWRWSRQTSTRRGYCLERSSLVEFLL